MCSGAHCDQPGSGTHNRPPRAAPALEPCQQAGPSIWQQFELNGPACLLLHHDCPRSDLTSAHKVADLHLHQVAAPKLAVDLQIEQRSISQTATLVEIETDFSDLLRFQSSFRTHGLSGIPNRTLGGGGFWFRHLHDRSPVTKLAICRTLADNDPKEWVWGQCRPGIAIPPCWRERPDLTGAADRAS